MTVNHCYEENRWGERYIPEINRAAFEQQSAASRFDSDLEFDPESENQLTIVVGSDSGLLYRYLCQRNVPESSRIILVEPEENAAAILEDCAALIAQRQADGLASRVMLFGADAWQAATLNRDDIAWFMAGTVVTAQSLCAISDYQNCYYPLYRDIREKVADRRHTIHNSYSHRTFIEQQLSNCVDARVPLKRSESFGQGKVAVVMGGGPSLDDHIDWIRENRSRLFVIAVSRLGKKLDALQLLPDMVVAMDPSPLTYAAAKHGTQWEHVPLVHSYHVAHMLPKQWRGPRYYLGDRFPWDNLQREPTDTVENAGPTVGHAAAVVAFQLGFSQILLSGVDLCMNKRGTSHAAGTPEAELLNLPGSYDMQVVTYSGERVGTSMSFYRSIEALEHIGNGINEGGDILFNLNPHATAIASIPQIDCHDVELPDSRPVFDTSDFHEADHQELDRIQKDLTRRRQDTLAIKALCDKADHCIDRIYGKGGKPGNPALHARLDALEARLEKAAPEMLGAIRYVMTPEFATLRKPSGFSDMNEEDMEDWARRYYRITRSGARFYRAALDQALDIVSLRRAEIALEPDVDLLLDAWQAQGTPGRVMMFHERLQSVCTPKQRDRLDAARHDFLHSLSTREKAHDDRVVSNFGTIRKTVQSLRYLRNKQCVDDLQSYSERLQGMAWPHGTIAVFIQAILADMRDDHGQCLPLYQQVIDDCAERLNSGEDSLESLGSLLEETLSALTRIYLEQQDGDAAASALGMLSEISPQYVPSYANLLDMLGNHEAAVELMQVFLKHFPHNWRAANQLARMHARAGNETARQAAEQQAESIRHETLRKQKRAA